MSSTDLEQRAQTGTLIQKVRGDEFTRDQIRQALPPSVSLDRFARSTITALMQNQDLAKADEASLFQSIVKCATDGLLPDGREAALVVYKGKVSYLPMIGGVRKIAAEFGWTIRTHVVYAADEFHVEQGTEDRILHRPAPFGTDRGDLVGAYAIAHHRDGRRSFFEVMNADDVAKAKAVAQTDRVWKQWPAQMWEKTVGHRIAKKLPLDPTDAERLTRVLNEAALETGGAADLLYGPHGERLAARSDFAEHPSGVSVVDVVPVETEVLPEEDSPAAAPADEATATSPPDPSGGVTNGEEGETADHGADASARGTDEQAASPSEPTEAEMVSSMESSLYVPTSGRFAEGGEDGPKTLGEIHALGEDGIKYLAMLLRKLDDGDLRTNTERFCLVAMPTDYAAAMATRAEA